jgi:hypothetical protein
MRCPVCRAENNATDRCRRCKADLGLLIKIERDRSSLLAAAELHAGRGDAFACMAAARHAHRLRADSDSWRLIALGALLKGDFAIAWLAYQRRSQLL